MACGKAVIASCIGDIPEVVGTEKQCGCLVVQGDAIELAGHIILLAIDPRLQKTIGEHVRQRIIDNFTWKKSVDRILSALGTSL
jgi:glycosyltransferase involved in cell wall biosynthesis